MNRRRIEWLRRRLLENGEQTPYATYGWGAYTARQALSHNPQADIDWIDVQIPPLLSDSDYIEKAIAKLEERP